MRAHWGVENRLHWVLDVVFHDDLARLRSGHGPENMAIIRHTAMNLICSTRATASLKVRRKKAAWNTNYLADVHRGAARDPFERFPWEPCWEAFQGGLDQGVGRPG